MVTVVVEMVVWVVMGDEPVSDCILGHMSQRPEEERLLTHLSQG